MSDEENFTLRSVDGDGPLSLREASLGLTRVREDTEPAAAPEPEAPVAAPDVSPDDTSTPDPAPEPVATEAPDAVEDLPPVEPPRSWSKEDKELFTGLPRETQERLAERERSRDTDFSRRQNDTTEQRRAAEAERAQLEQARKQYEEALPTLLQSLQQSQMSEFTDIKTMADVEKLAREDWPRYALWDAQQKKVALVAEEMKVSQQRQTEETQKRLAEFARLEEPKLYQEHPELADKAKMSEASTKAVEYLQKKGLTEQDFDFLRSSGLANAAWFQSLVYNNLKYQDAQTAVKKAIVKPVPKVQRPGVAAPKSEPQDIRLVNLNKRFEAKPDWKNAAELLIAQREGK